MLIDIRFTKFPFIFWTSTKAISSEVDCKNRTLKTENGEYEIKKMNFYLFFLVKYAPIILFVAIFYNRYDISYETTRLISYIFAVSYFIPLVLFDDVLRKYVLLAMMFAAFVVGFSLGDFSLGAFAIKYFILLFCIFIFIVDLKFQPFTLYKNGKIFAHFTLLKSVVNEAHQGLKQ